MNWKWTFLWIDFNQKFTANSFKLCLFLSTSCSSLCYIHRADSLPCPTLNMCLLTTGCWTKCRAVASLKLVRHKGMSFNCSINFWLKRFHELNCHKSVQASCIIFLWFMESNKTEPWGKSTNNKSTKKEKNPLKAENNKILFPLLELLWHLETRATEILCRCSLSFKDCLWVWVCLIAL